MQSTTIIIHAYNQQSTKHPTPTQITLTSMYNNNNNDDEDILILSTHKCIHHSESYAIIMNFHHFKQKKKVFWVDEYGNDTFW